MKITSLPTHAAVLAAILLVGHPAWSAPISRNTTVANLNTDAAWGTGVAGSQPGSGDVATWDSTSLGGNQTLGSSVSWGGVNIGAGTPTAGPAITDTSYTLTLGAQGIYCGGSNSNGFTINDAVSLAANQPWVVGSGSSASITVAGGISGGYAIDLQSASGNLGVLNLNAANTFSGGFTNEANAIVIYTNVTTVASGGVLTSSPFGTGPLTIIGGTLTAGTKAFFNPLVYVLGDFTWSTAFRDDVSGVFNFGGATRMITLTRSVTPANVVVGGGQNSIRFNPAAVSGGLTTNFFMNGNLEITAASSVVAPNFVNVTFGAGANANAFVNNAGLILGSQVYGNQSGSAFAFGSNPANYPALTLQAGAYWSLCDATSIRNTSISSLAGAGTVVNNGGAASGTGTLSINGGGNSTTTTFSGVIKDTELATFPTATAGLITAITKSGGTTQILSGTNTYTGPTAVNGGTLLIDGNNGNSPVTVNAGGTLGGSGTIGGAVTVNASGTLTPGTNGMGTLTISNNLTLSATSTNQFVVTTVGGVSNSVAVGGVLTPDGSVIEINTAGDAALGAGTNTLFTYASTGGSPFSATPVFVTAQTGLATNALIVNDMVGHIKLVITNQPSGPLSTNAYLASLVLSNNLNAAVSLTPGFTTNGYVYYATNTLPANQVSVTVTDADPTATNTLIMNGGVGIMLPSGTSSGLQNLNPGTNTVKVRVVSQDQSVTNIYTVNVFDQPSQTAPQLTSSYNGSQLTLSWPADHLGYRLLMQTNNLNKGVSGNIADWGTVAGSTVITSTNITILKTGVTNEFYQLVYP